MDPRNVWPRVVAAVALVLLASCGVTLLVIKPRLKMPASLSAQSNWVLAGALPTSGEVPAGWGYGLAGELQRSTPASSDLPQPLATLSYEPPACGHLPRMLDHREGGQGPHVNVDRYTTIEALEPALADVNATGDVHEIGPNATLTIWAVGDGPAQIAEYTDWLTRCNSYHITDHDKSGKTKAERTVTTVRDEPWPGGTDVAVSVTRSFGTARNTKPPLTYHVAYFALRGVILECSIFMKGPDVDVVKGLAAATIAKLRTL